MQTARRWHLFSRVLANPVFSRSERRLLAGLTVVTACSWGRFFATGSLKVDRELPGAALTGFALLAALVAGWALAVAGWQAMLADPPARPRRTAFVALGVATLMLPMLSNDVFSLLSYGARRGGGPRRLHDDGRLAAGALLPVAR